MSVGQFRYLLDTNVISALARQPRGLVSKRLALAGESLVCTSLIVVCELRFGLKKRSSSRLTIQVEAILELLPILSLDSPVEDHYADIRNVLEVAGSPIGPNDLLIAAHARSLGLTVVTENLREFSRVPGLTVENWLEAV